MLFGNVSNSESAPLLTKIDRYGNLGIIQIPLKYLRTVITVMRHQQDQACGTFHFQLKVKLVIKLLAGFLLSIKTLFYPAPDINQTTVT